MDMELSDEGEMEHIPCDSTVYCYIGWGVAMKHIHVQMRLARLNAKHGRCGLGGYIFYFFW